MRQLTCKTLYMNFQQGTFLAAFNLSYTQTLKFYALQATCTGCTCTVSMKHFVTAANHTLIITS